MGFIEKFEQIWSKNIGRPKEIEAGTKAIDLLIDYGSKCYRKAAYISNAIGQKKKAAELYERSGDLEAAVGSYILGGYIEEAIGVYERSGQLEKALEIAGHMFDNETKDTVIARINSKLK